MGPSAPNKRKRDRVVRRSFLEYTLHKRIRNYAFFLFACVEQTLKNDPYIFSISFNNHISSYPRFIFRLLSNGIGNRLHYQQGKPLGTHTSVPFFLFLLLKPNCVSL